VPRTARPPRPARRRLLTIGGAAAAVVAAMVVTAVPAFACPSLTITASPTTVTAGNDTTLTITATSNGNYTGAYVEVASTGGPGALTSFTTLGASGCGGGITSCAADGTYYKLLLPALTNGEKFTYTIDLTTDSSDAAGTFTPTAEFFESNGTNIGAQSGPLVTINPATVNLSVTGTGGGDGGGSYDDYYNITNNGPGTLTAMTFTINISSGFTITSLGSDYDLTCVLANPTTTCTLSAPLASGATAAVDATFSGGLLTTGTATDTGTITSTTPANTGTPTSTSSSCGYLLGLETC
jgi:hypothetical protein